MQFQRWHDAYPDLWVTIVDTRVIAYIAEFFDRAEALEHVGLSG